MRPKCHVRWLRFYFKHMLITGLGHRIVVKGSGTAGKNYPDLLDEMLRIRIPCFYCYHVMPTQTKVHKKVGFIFIPNLEQLYYVNLILQRFIFNIASHFTIYFYGALPLLFFCKSKDCN